jgi:DNA repair exonuclease SbcCD ATPase subunit
MELSELSQRLTFLDEERRKDKELISTLLERLEAQTGKLQVQARQIQELEGLLNSTRAELVKFAQIDRAMEQLRQELTLLIETNEEKREKAHRELSRLRQVEQETFTRQIAEIRKEMKPLPRYDEEITSLHAELSRLNAPVIMLQHQLAELDKRLEDRMQSVVYLEEQRRQDSRRIAQLESDATALNKKSDDLASKLPLIEESIQAKRKELDRAAELLEEQGRVIENQRVTEFRWERQVAEWGKLVEEIKQETVNLTSQMVRTREQHELVRRALADLDPFRERIERRQDEMAEMQRIAEDRQKRVVEEWHTERQKEWDRFRLENDERWRENARFNERRSAHVQAIENYLLQLSPQVQALWEVQEAWVQAFMVGPREWTATWDKLIKQRPPMPESFKAVARKPENLPKIRPLPSAQSPKDDEQGE